MSVVTVLAALAAASDGGGALLVDLDGGLPAVLGISDPDGPGLGEWSRAPADLPADALGHLEVQLAPGLALLPRGEGPISTDRVDLLRALLGAEARSVLVDGGQLSLGAERLLLARSATRTLLVTPACPAAVRRLGDRPVVPSGVVIVHQHRCRGGWEAVAHAATAPIVAELDHDAVLARAVDLGLLGRRLPRRVARAAAALR